MRQRGSRSSDTCREPRDDAPPVRQATEQDLDAIAPLVAPRVVFQDPLAGLPAPDAGLCPFVFPCVSQPVRVRPPIGDQPAGLRQASLQGRRPLVVADLSCRQGEPEGSAVCIGDGVQPCVHAAFRSPDPGDRAPLFARGLDAVRCAFRQAASIMIVLELVPPAARPARIRAKTPVSLQRFQRLHSVLAGPYSLGASHHRKSSASQCG
jgi:hypothetical protein